MPTSTTPSLLGAHTKADVSETDGTPPRRLRPPLASPRPRDVDTGRVCPAPRRDPSERNPSPNLDQPHRADPGRLRAPGDLTRRAGPSLEIDQRQRSVTPNRGNESLMTLPSQYKQQQRRTSFCGRGTVRDRGRQFGKHSKRHKGDQGAGTHHATHLDLGSGTVPRDSGSVRVSSLMFAQCRFVLAPRSPSLKTTPWFQEFRR